MALERLDASWRRRYVEQASTGEAPEDSCIFCALAEAAIDEDSGVVDRDATSFVVLNAFPYGSGHVLVLPRRHVAAIDELDAAESAGLWQATTRALRASDGPRARGSPGTCTSTCCPAGAGTRTS